MKGFLFLFILLIPITCIGQDTLPELNSRWENLKSALKRRSEVVVTLSDYLLTSDKIDPTSLKESKENAAALINELDKVSKIDSLSINLIKAKHDQVTDSFKKVLGELKSNKELKKDEEVVKYTMQLEGLDNRIYFEKKEFNKVSREHGKSNLVFGDDEHTNIMNNYY